jgi:hypothetical protein
MVLTKTNIVIKLIVSRLALLIVFVDGKDKGTP